MKKLTQTQCNALRQHQYHTQWLQIKHMLKTLQKQYKEDFAYDA